VLVAVLAAATTLCLLGYLSRTEVLPLFGGSLVVAHRLLDRAERPPHDGTGVGVVLAAGLGGLTGAMGLVGW
jgi:hypothetical protein